MSNNESEQVVAKNANNIVLVINAGSSSVKFSLFKQEDLLSHGIVEKIGNDDCDFDWHIGPIHSNAVVDVKNHSQAIKLILDSLVSKEVVASLEEIDAVGHRVVHGGDKFSAAAKVTEEVKSAIKECIPLAPLHNPHNLSGIEAMEAHLPGKPQAVVFDTAFHQTLPEHAFLYPLPYELYEQEKIRRYGFHGTSHQYVAHKASELLGKSLEDLNLITVHMGNGSSACAIQKGKSVDTSMGFTPLEGLMMGTRCGSIDPAIPLFLQSIGKSPEEVDKLMNKKSGLKGVSGISNDMRDLYSTDNKRAWLAIDMFCYRVIKTIGSYLAVLGGCDAIIFTAGIGEHVAIAREKIVNGLGAFGIALNVEANKNSDTYITTPDSKIPVLIVPTNEELMIARQTRQTLV